MASTCFCTTHLKILSKSVLIKLERKHQWWATASHNRKDNKCKGIWINRLPSTWCGLSLVTRFLWTCNSGSLVSSSSSSTSLVVMGHVTCADSSTTIVCKQASVSLNWTTWLWTNLSWVWVCLPLGVSLSISLSLRCVSSSPLLLSERLWSLSASCRL